MPRSYSIALICAVVFILWMGSGVIFKSDDADAEAKQASTQAQAFKVAVTRAEAVMVPLRVTSHGQVEASRVLQLRAQTEGEVEEVAQTFEGLFVEANQSIVSLALDDRELQLVEQQALLTARKQNYARLQQLATQNYQSQSELELALANLKATEANIARIKLDLERTRISSPFAGTLERLLVEQGDFVQVNTPVAVILDTSSLLVTAPIAQQDIQKIQLGAKAMIELATGESVDARVSYIPPRADSQTRTFPVELTIDNPSKELKTGVSAKVSILLDDISAHFVSPALISLNDSGKLGVKTVDQNNTVHFHEIEIVQALSDGAYVTGLPAIADIIVSGQGFVTQGNEVRTEELTTSGNR
ncbi:efflux RND transporter periplasmic adaptor subunit [Ningiella sp. W23]|uniref:efflux RND transporter periplasmic adaptor subunit n=1 Tax=Ningiella sp. W23 TaxID=3023715 RepID=UPI003757F808